MFSLKKVFTLPSFFKGRHNSHVVVRKTEVTDVEDQQSTPLENKIIHKLLVTLKPAQDTLKQKSTYLYQAQAANLSTKESNESKEQTNNLDSNVDEISEKKDTFINSAIYQTLNSSYELDNYKLQANAYQTIQVERDSGEQAVNLQATYHNVSTDSKVLQSIDTTGFKDCELNLKNSRESHDLPSTLEVKIITDLKTPFKASQNVQTTQNIISHIFLNNYDLCAVKQEVGQVDLVDNYIAQLNPNTHEIDHALKADFKDVVKPTVLAKITNGCDYDGNKYTLKGLKTHHWRLTSLIDINSIHLDLSSQRVKGILVEVLKREFSGAKAEVVNNVLLALLQRDREGKQYIHDNTVLMRCIVPELEYTKMHFVCLKNPTVYDLNYDLFAKYVYVLLISPNDMHAVVQSLPVIIKKINNYTNMLIEEGNPTDNEEIWKDFADLDWTDVFATAQEQTTE
ncbi:hypothetical protein [Psittacicella hinzii]|uniref:Uncharacterized protein n=1 Tax=Psittacicella hinzii TaxID=2028575 RepID=A0A3A1YPN7_9GAMM|nr:hypothetical protein [Psittacicella hinzii]RIY39575.1 hypothetical protein CKF58_01940 [Psittacicella hinzii]